MTRTPEALAARCSPAELEHLAQAAMRLSLTDADVLTDRAYRETVLRILHDLAPTFARDLRALLTLAKQLRYGQLTRERN